MAGACLGAAALASLALTLIVWRRSGRDIPFGAFYPEAMRFFMFSLPMRSTDWQTTRIAGHDDVIFCQKANLVISAVCFAGFLWLVMG